MINLNKIYSELSDKGKVVFNVAVIVVVVALLDQLFLGPVLDKLQTIDQSIQTQENSIVRDKRFLVYKERILKEGDVFKKYYSEMVADDDVVNADFLSTVERIATKSSVNLIKSNPTESKKQKKFNEYYASIDLSGELENVITFMHAVNTTDELLKIVKFNMTPKRGTSSEVNASMTIVKLIVKSETLPTPSQ